MTDDEVLAWLKDYEREACDPESDMPPMILGVALAKTRKALARCDYTAVTGQCHLCGDFGAPRYTHKPTCLFAAMLRTKP